MATEIYNHKAFIKQEGIAGFYLKENLVRIPISSYVRTWISRDGQPYKYEFRGEEYQGYHNPDDLIIRWEECQLN